MARGLYGLTVAWWKGAFTPESAASAIANMLDKDYACEIWKIEVRGGWYYNIKSESLGAKVMYYLRYEKCSLYLKRQDPKDNDPWFAVNVSAYDDYLIANACERWIKRSKELAERRKESESQRLINQRITEGYIKTVEMVEKRILSREPETANELRALTTDAPPEPKEKEKKNVSAATFTSSSVTHYYIPNSLQQGTTGSGPTKSKSRSSRGD